MDGLRKTGQLGLHCQGKTRECACYDGPPLSEPAISWRQDTGSSCPHCRAWMGQGLSPIGTAAPSAFGPVSKEPFCPWATCPGFIRACLTHFPYAGEHTTQRAAAFCPGSRASPVPKGHIRGSVFLRGMPKALTVKKFRTACQVFLRKASRHADARSGDPAAGPARAYTVLVCCFSISRRHRPASRRPRQAACQRG